MIKIDVSEIKTYRGCRRQWLLSSRNRFHLRPKNPSAALTMGTLFHEAIGELYLEVHEDKVLAMVKREATADSYVPLLAMLKGYSKNVLPGDLERFRVLDIEHHFEFTPRVKGEVVDPDMLIVGSIDMIAIDDEENKIYGFEHKTTKTFRDESYLWMDEQPRVYTMALQNYVDQYNDKQMDAWYEKCLNTEVGVGEPLPEKPEKATLGGVYMNEVKKLLRDFQYRRTLCVYPESDMENFTEAFFGSCCALKHSVDVNDVATPSPGYFSCQMCAFREVCQTYMYATVQEDKIIEEFADILHKRTEDHLEEKLERSAD